MSQTKELLNKIEVKQAQADKHVRLAKCAGSSVKRNTFYYHARRFTAQVQALKLRLQQLQASKAQ